MPLVRSSVGAVLTAPGTYTTLFPTTENPLSEGGRWLHLSPLTTPMQVSASGKCHGTQTGSGGFDDSHAYFPLGGIYNYEIEVTWFKTGTPANNTEGEILFRYWDGYATYAGDFSDTNSKGYELSYHSEGSYAHVGRWQGADLVAPSPLGQIVTGDVWRARIEGFRIRWWINEVALADVTDTNQALRHGAGYVGIGCFIGSGATANNVLGPSKVIVRPLP